MVKVTMEQLVTMLGEKVALAKGALATLLPDVALETGGNNRTEVSYRVKVEAGSWYDAMITLTADGGDYTTPPHVRYEVYKGFEKRQTLRFKDLGKAITKFVEFTKGMFEFAARENAIRDEKQIREAKAVVLRELTDAHLTDIGLVRGEELAKAFSLSEDGSCWIFRHTEKHYTYRGNPYESHFPSDKGKALTVDQARQLVALLK